MVTDGCIVEVRRNRVRTVCPVRAVVMHRVKVACMPSAGRGQTERYRIVRSKLRL